MKKRVVLKHIIPMGRRDGSDTVFLQNIGNHCISPSEVSNAP